MKPEQLLAHFERISEAPRAVPRLRRFILDLAVRGSLVEQDPKDAPASELVKRIHAERARLLAAGEVKTRDALQPVEATEISFPIPSGWEVMRMGSLARKLGAGSTPRGGKSVYQSDGVAFLRSQNVHDDGLRLEHVALIRRQTHNKMPGTHVQQQDILLNITGASIGRCALVPPTFVEGNVSQHVAIIRLLLPDIREFIHLSLRSPFFQKIIDDVQVGVSREGLSMQRLRLFPMLLPPLHEQHRIVAKVNELMALCDELASAKTEREARRDRVAAASLQRLSQSTQAGNHEAFREQATFHLRHLPRLVTRPEHVRRLRATILDLAFRGFLTQQWRQDGGAQEPAADYLGQLMAGRRHRWDAQQREGSMRRYAAPLAPTVAGVPHIPPSWLWASCDAICAQITDGEHIQPAYQADGFPMLTASHVRDGYVTFEGCGFISQADFKRCVMRCRPEEGDILVVSVGATTGRAAIVGACRPFVLVRSVLLLKPLVSPQFLLRWLQSPWCLTWMRQASEASAQPHLYIGDTKRMPVPLPPPLEQRSIVARVDELMDVCDKLDAQLATTAAECARLLEAVLQQAVVPVSCP